MRTLLIGFLLFGFCSTFSAQKEQTESIVHTKSDVTPHWKSCSTEKDNIDKRNCTEDRLAEWIGKNLVYPKKAKDNGIHGTVLIRVVIDKEGSVLLPEIVYPSHPLLEQEALRIIESIPVFSPGKINDKPVKVYFVFPVNFELD